MKIIFGNIKYLFPLLLFLFAILINYFLGSRNIQDAAKHNFNGGICYACQTCKETYEICQKRYGFDIYNLIFSIIPVSFVVALFNKILFKNSLSKILFQSIILGIFWLISVEVIVKIVQIPVLYTHFQEGTQSLNYQYFSLFTELIVVLTLLETIFSGIFGYLVGAVIGLFLLKKVRK